MLFLVTTLLGMTGLWAVVLVAPVPLNWSLLMLCDF